MTRTAFIVAVIIAQFALLGWLSLRLSNDENTTCQIQAQGLRAQVHLRNFLVDLNTAELQPSTQAKTRKQLRKLPPKLRQIEQNMLAELNAYARVEARQPRTRSC